MVSNDDAVSDASSNGLVITLKETLELADYSHIMSLVLVKKYNVWNYCAA